jgi:hypothetical protein
MSNEQPKDATEAIDDPRKDTAALFGQIPKAKANMPRNWRR